MVNRVPRVRAGNSRNINGAGGPRGLQNTGAMRSGLRGQELFNAVFGESALRDVRPYKEGSFSFLSTWTASGGVDTIGKKATLRCTIDQFESLLELAPEDWVETHFLDREQQIADAKDSAKRRRGNREIGNHEMRGVSYRQWTVIADLLGMGVYFNAFDISVNGHYRMPESMQRLVPKKPTNSAIRLIVEAHETPAIRHFNVGAGFFVAG